MKLCGLKLALEIDDHLNKKPTDSTDYLQWWQLLFGQGTVYVVN